MYRRLGVSAARPATVASASPNATSPRPNWHALPWEGETLQPAQSSSLSATVFLFLTKHRLYHIYHNSFAATSRLVHHGGFSERYLQLHVGALGVSLVHSVLSHTSLTRNLYRSAITTLFATKSGGSLSMSTGYVDLQPSLSIKPQMMWSACRSLPRAGSIVPLSSLYATVSR